MGWIVRRPSAPSRSPSRTKVVLAIFLFLGVPPVSFAQAYREWQGQATGTVLASPFLGVGLGFGVRPGGRLRMGASVNAGDQEGALAARGEVVASYHLDPFRRRGFTPYLGGGVAVQAARGEAKGLLLAVLGVEMSPAGRIGWFVESGVGGGLRFSAGVRVRRRRSGG
jgi:hypothetical protein